MATVELKHLHVVRAKGRVYVYAWRGGPRIRTDHAPGTPGFFQAYAEAIAEHRAPDPTRFRAIVVDYRGSDALRALAPSTQRNWRPWLDRIEAHFGELPISSVNRTEKIRRMIRQWRAGFAATPRTADYALQVLSRVCAHGVDPMGKLADNPCTGIKHLYAADRAEIVWTPADIAQFKAAASAELGHAVDLAANTGLRLGDLLRLAWSHIGEHEIVLPTGKSRQKRAAVIPLHADLRDVLAAIPRRSPVVLTSTKGRPWTSNGFGTSFQKAKADCGFDERDLHFHDLRGTAATRFYLAGLDTRVIAEIMGWEETAVEKIIRRYVGRAAATQQAIRALDSARTGTDAVKPAVKPPHRS